MCVTEAFAPSAGEMASMCIQKWLAILPNLFNSCNLTFIYSILIVKIFEFSSGSAIWWLEYNTTDNSCVRSSLKITVKIADHNFEVLFLIIHLWFEINCFWANMKTADENIIAHNSRICVECCHLEVLKIKFSRTLFLIHICYWHYVLHPWMSSGGLNAKTNAKIFTI